MVEMLAECDGPPFIIFETLGDRTLPELRPATPVLVQTLFTQHRINIMLQLLQIVTLLLVAIAMAQSLAHALELPGKMRLGEHDYRVVQTIYYPGFTIGGASEPLAVVVTLVLLFLTSHAAAFWLTLVALVLLVAMHAVFWLVTQPVNKHWLKDEKLGGAGKAFFGTGGNVQDGWTALRDRWEYSHVARAALAVASFVLLLVAVTLDA